MTKIYHYTVEGFGSFPIDMLRYDEAWPASEADSGTIASGNARRTVALRGLRAPTLKRWESFMWKAGTAQAVRI